MQPHGAGPQKIELRTIKSIVAVASGKGGVGKSTVAVNLALALHMQGHHVGLLDADLYGPSIPIMLGVPRGGSPDDAVSPRSLRTQAHVDGLPRRPRPGTDLARSYGGQVPETVLNGGPLGRNLDYMVIDLPPGTGDAQLTLTQALPLSGAVIVTTPQDVSLIDARKGLEMFRQVRVPVLGIVENMSYFIGEDGKRYEIFRHGGGRKLAGDAGVPFLGEIPIDPRVAECGDSAIRLYTSIPIRRLPRRTWRWCRRSRRN